MSTRLNLVVHELTAMMRGDDPDRPVIVGTDGMRVAMLLDPKMAGALSRIIARFDALTEDADLDFEFDADVWRHALVDLLAAQAEAGQRPVPVYAMPYREVV